MGFLFERIMGKEIKIGQQIGKLKVLARQTSKKGKDYCFCRCDCGEIGISIPTKDLANGYVTSCRKCIGIELRGNEPTVFKHPLHRVWSDMIMRCENPNRPYYYLYGGRGIKVCEEWRNTTNGYLNFYNWAMQNGYKFEPTEPKKETKRIRNKWSLDRIDLNGDYCPNNCRWADVKTQNENKRADLIIEHNGQMGTVKQFLKKYNAKILYFYYLLRQGMTEIQAVDYIASLK